MPRQGDGSGDSGRYDAHAIVHGTDGDDSLQHTKHVAPMPKVEKGEALPGMNASGGAAAPLNDASEQYGASAPRHERRGADDDPNTYSSTTTTSSGSNNTGSTNTGRSEQHSSSTGQESSHPGNEQTGHNTRSSHASHTEHSTDDLDQVQRNRAERFVNLDEEDVGHAVSSGHNTGSALRSSQRAPRDVGGKADVQQMHGKASGGGKQEQQGSGHGQYHQSKNISGENGQRSGGQDEDENEYESEIRHKAEKFVNLNEEN